MTTPENVSIVGCGRATEVDYQARRMLPAFRKSTRNMILALAATERALADVSGADAGAFTDNARTALVFGSSYGEIETTKDFLVTLEDLRMARPLLFQNSLHNSTTGFLTLQLKLTGPALTISAESSTGEESLNTALTALRSGVADRAIVTVTDSIPTDLRPAFRALYGDGGDDALPGDGSACVLLARGEVAGRRALLRDRFRVTAAVAATPAPSGVADLVREVYEADALDAFVRVLQDHRASGARSFARTHRSGSTSTLDWVRA